MSFIPIQFASTVDPRIIHLRCYSCSAKMTMPKMNAILEHNGKVTLVCQDCTDKNNLSN